MSQILSSLSNKFEQGIFAALCFDFSLSKNFGLFLSPSLAKTCFFLSSHSATALVRAVPVVIGSAKVIPFSILTSFFSEIPFFFQNRQSSSICYKHNANYIVSSFSIELYINVSFTFFSNTLQRTPL